MSKLLTKSDKKESGVTQPEVQKDPPKPSQPAKSALPKLSNKVKWLEKSRWIPGKKKVLQPLKCKEKPILDILESEQPVADDVSILRDSPMDLTNDGDAIDNDQNVLVLPHASSDHVLPEVMDTDESLQLQPSTLRDDLDVSQLASQTAVLLSVSDQIMATQCSDEQQIATKKRDREVDVNPLQTFVNSLPADSVAKLLDALNFGGESSLCASTVEMRSKICQLAQAAAPDDPVNYVKDLDVTVFTRAQFEVTSSPLKPPSKIRKEALESFADPSVVAPKDRKAAQLALRAIDPQANIELATKRLQNSLEKHLRQRHPIHDFLNQQSVNSLRVALQSLLPSKSTPKSGRDIKNALASFCFKKAGTSPLTYLRKELDKIAGNDAFSLASKQQQKNHDAEEKTSTNEPDKSIQATERQTESHEKDDGFEIVSEAERHQALREFYHVDLTDDSAIIWPPPFGESIEDTFRKLAQKKCLRESYVKDYVDSLFNPNSWQGSEFKDRSIQVGKTARREKVMDRLDFNGFPYSQTDTTAALRKNLAKNLKEKHDIHDFIDFKLNNDLQMKVYRQLKGDLPDYLAKRPAFLRQKIAEACFDAQPRSPIACLLDSLEVVAMNTYKLVKENGSEPVDDNWSTVIPDDISMNELKAGCKKWGLTVPIDPDFNKLKEKLEKVLVEKHPIRKFVLDLQHHTDAHEVVEMAKLLKQRNDSLKIRTFKQQAKAIADYCIATAPNGPFEALDELWVEVQELLERRHQDYSLTSGDASKDDIVAKLTGLRVQFDPEDSRETLLGKLTEVEISEHPVTHQLNTMKRTELVKMSQTMKIVRLYRLNADGLRKEISARIFNERPEAPLDLFKTIENAVKMANVASDGWRGIRLFNRGNTCYLNSDMNGLLSIKAIRNGLDTMQEDPFTSGTNNK